MELYHDGVKGMRWGVRRYQNEDGSLTELGIERYRKLSKKDHDAAVNNILAYQNKKPGRNPTLAQTQSDIKRLRAYRKRSKFEKKIDTEKYLESRSGAENLKKYKEALKKINDVYDQVLKDAKTKSYSDADVEKAVSSNKNYQRATDYIKQFDDKYVDQLAESYIYGKLYKELYSEKS